MNKCYSNILGRLNLDSNLYKTNNQSLSLLYRQVYFKCDWCPVLYVNFVLIFFSIGNIYSVCLLFVTYLMICTKDFPKVDLQA